MENIIEKMKQMFQSDFEHVTTVIKDKQDPITILNRYVKESEAEIEKAAVLIRRQRMLKDEFLKELKQVEAIVEKRKEQVKVATAAGEAELAEMALKYQVQAENQSERLQLAYETSLDQLAELEQKHEEMKLKVKDMHIKRLELMGRENILSMKEKVNKMIDEAEFGQAADKFERIESDMKQQEKTADQLYDITVFDARIQQLAKEMNKAE
ncbi:PspA/IM30 family protein [Bacillus sp. FJAT-50079]|uniref:PspA/IM30 family protein n=1 Tax=Bacillus sp. FJAT-50079 TaxID=2833577 RepID=UPI001BC99EFD|nr:PspA/IM30 family protein [Bacillus sp. FJAT-50079]MBS4207785.1 PspA/IM30 family protein [Bacillus sp. FJAT-50079]